MAILSLNEVARVSFDLRCAYAGSKLHTHD